MTTSVKIEAHCSDEKEVIISISGEATSEIIILEDGDSYELAVYDDKEVSIKEALK